MSGCPDASPPGGAAGPADDGAADRAPARLTFCPDGPVLVRGRVELLDGAGDVIVPSRRTVALCRCGGSAIKPWCDGTHKVNGFRAP